MAPRSVNYHIKKKYNFDQITVFLKRKNETKKIVKLHHLPCERLLR